MKKLLLFLIPLVLWNCEDVIKLDLPEGEALLVINGQITDQPGHTRVLLSETAGYFDEEENPPVEGAIISLLENNVPVDTFLEEAPGFYRSNYVGATDNAYRIDVELPDGRQYSSDAEILPRVPPIDSVYYRYEGDLPSLEDGYYVYFAMQELPGKPDFYRWKYYFNGEYQNAPSDIALGIDDFWTEIICLTSGLALNRSPWTIRCGLSSTVQPGNTMITGY